MRAGRFLDLYVSETREHLHLLTGSILRLERGESAAIEDAFRAAHTIKGLASAMGHGRAAASAHDLEELLAGVRSAGTGVDGPLADRLLAGADALEAAIAEELRDGARSGSARAVGPAPPVRAAGGRGATGAPTTFELPAHARSIVVARLAPDAAMPEARAALIRRALADEKGVLGVRVSAGPDAQVELHVLLSGTADLAAVEAIVRESGDVTDVRVEGPERVIGPDAPVESAETVAAPMSVRVDRRRLDELADGIAELAVLHARAVQAPDLLATHRAGAVLAGLQRTVLELRMVPVSSALERLDRLVRDAAREAGKNIDFRLVGGDIELDKTVLDALVDPLVHMVRNAVDHGIEAPQQRKAAGKPGRGTISIEVTRNHGSVQLRVTDDGSGIDRRGVAERGRALGLLDDTDSVTDEDLLRLVFQPGFSTAQAVTGLSGRGVGLDVVAGRVRGLGGAIEIASDPGEGTTFILRVPITLAVAHALRVRIGEEEYAVPITHVTEVVPIGSGPDSSPTGVEVRGDHVPLVDLARILSVPGAAPSTAVVAELGERRIALAVDEVLGHEQIVVKSFDAPAGLLPVFAGATMLPDGRPALLIDPLGVLG